MDKAQKKVLKIFHDAAKNVPAYLTFLKKHKIKPEKIKKWVDFQKIPLMDKKNYLWHYPYKNLFKKGFQPPIISMSSASSGTPFYWPRGFDQEERGGKIHEIIFRDIFKIGKRKTLVIVCFSMGTWIAGTFTANCCRYLIQKGYNLSIMTPGIEKEDALAILRDFAPNFETVILAGYPPFLMDIIDEATNRKINFKKFDLRLLFAGENFSEKWREIIKGIAGIQSAKTTSINSGQAASASIYGTADADILGHETPLTIFLRKKAMEDKKLANALFGEAASLPSLVQYYPEEKYFEGINGELVFTTATAIPLIRYNIHDNGKIISYSEVKNIVKKFNLEKEVVKNGLNYWKNPLIALFSRKDVSTTFYALNIYPENIKAGIENDLISRYFSGKFLASAKTVNKGRDQKFILKLELKRKVQPSETIKELAKNIIFETLIKVNTEYRKLYSSIGKSALPHIELILFGDPIFQVKKSKFKWMAG